MQSRCKLRRRTRTERDWRAYHSHSSSELYEDISIYQDIGVRMARMRMRTQGCAGMHAQGDRVEDRCDMFDIRDYHIDARDAGGDYEEVGM